MTSLVGILAYVLVIHFMLFYLAALAGIWTVRFPPVFADNPWLSWVLGFNLAALFLRAIQRAYFVSRIYGYEQGLLSLPRMVVCTAVNFMAAARAWRVFLQNAIFGAPVTWDKTAHFFPTADQLLARRRRLGDLLLTWQVLDHGRLEEALAEQKKRDIPLGRVLMAQGWLDDETLAEAIAVQADLPRCHLSAEDVKLHAGRHATGPERALPDHLHRPRAGWHAPHRSGRSSARRSAVGGRQCAGRVPRQFVARESEIASGLRLLSEAPDQFTTAEHGNVPLLGDVLMDHGLVKRADFEHAIADYRPSVTAASVTSSSRAAS